MTWHKIRLLLRAGDLHDCDGRSYCDLGTKLVCLGSLADIRERISGVRFTPQSGHG
jgi:hypothetical protein